MLTIIIFQNGSQPGKNTKKITLDEEKEKYV